MFTLIDLVKMQPNKTAEDATEYFESLEPVFQRHGLRRKAFQVIKPMRGDLTPGIVNLFETENVQVSMSNMQADPDFQAMADKRNALFDLTNSPVILTQPAD